jgi:hypothetical protein
LSGHRLSFSLLLILSLALVPSYKGFDSLVNRISYPFQEFTKMQNGNNLVLDSTVTSNISDRINTLKPIINKLNALDIEIEFANMTNHNADFRYLNMKSAFRQIAPYNMVTYREQIKSIDIARAKNVVYLLHYKSLVSDGSVSLRNPYLYHEIIFNNKLLVCQSNNELSYWAWPTSFPNIPGCKTADMNGQNSPWELPALEQHELGLQPYYWGSTSLVSAPDHNIGSRPSVFQVLLVQIKCDSPITDLHAEVDLVSEKYKDSIKFGLKQEGRYLVPLYAYSSFLLSKKVETYLNVPPSCSILNLEKVFRSPLF